MSDVLERQQGASSWSFIDDGAGAVEIYPLRKSIIHLGPQTEGIRIDLRDVVSAKTTSRPRDVPKFTDADWDLFQELLEFWKKERGATSFISEMVMCPSYQRIIGLGEKAIPMIIRQMEIEGDDPDHWDWALEAITRESIIPESDWGDTRAIASRWKRWASAKYGW